MFQETNGRVAGLPGPMELFDEVETTPLATWVSSCNGCGRVHWLEDWLVLPFVKVDPGFGIDADQEVRGCRCGREVRSPITVGRLRGSEL